MSRSERAAKGFATSILQYFTQILVQALLAPIVLKVAGREALGAYAAIMQTVSFLGLVDIAHSWSLERFLGQSIGLEDGGERFRRVFTTARTLLLISNTIFATLVVIFSLYIARLFHLSPGIAGEAKHALWVIAVWSIVRTPLAAYMNALVATQEMASSNLIAAFAGILRTVASLTFVLLGGGLFGLMLAGTVAEGFGSSLARFRFRKIHPTLMPSWGIPDKALLREMIGFGGHAMFLNVGNMLVFSSGNTLAGVTSGAAMASTFYTTQMPTMTAYNIMLRLSESATPAINDLWGRKEVERLRLALIRLTRLLLLMALPLATGVILFNKDLVVSWVGPQQYGGTLLTVTLALFTVVIAVQRIGIVYSFVFGWMRVLTITALLQGLANFGLAFYLGKRIGLGGITLALLIVVLPQTSILWYKVGRFLHVNVLGLFTSSALRAAVPLGAATALSLLVHSRVTIAHHHLGGFIAEASTFAGVYGILAYFMSLNDQDRSEISRYGGNIAQRVGLRRRLDNAIANS